MQDDEALKRSVKLPEPAWREMRPTNPPKVGAEWYSADQVRAAILAERERCAMLCEVELSSHPDDGDPWNSGARCAATYCKDSIRGVESTWGKE